MSEKYAAEDIQVTLREIEGINNESVTINDYSPLDGPRDNGPFIIILTADDFISRQDSRTAENTYSIPMLLVVKYTDWLESLNEFREYRQLIIDKFNETEDQRSPGHANSNTGFVTADVIRNEGPITQLYDNWRDPDTRGNDLPDYLAQRLIIEVREN